MGYLFGLFLKGSRVKEGFLGVEEGGGFLKIDVRHQYYNHHFKGFQDCQSSDSQ